MGRVKARKERWKVVGVYVKREGLGKILEEVGKLMERRGEKIMMILDGDLNVKTGDKEREMREKESKKEVEGRVNKQSKDKVINKKGKEIRMVREGGVGNFQYGNIEGNRERE